jgi:hypothetical protein
MTPRPQRLRRQNTGPISDLQNTEIGIYPFPSVDSEDTIHKFIKLDENVLAHSPFQEAMQSMEDEIDNFLPSNNNISCYATPSALNTMRTLDQPIDSEE